MGEGMREIEGEGQEEAEEEARQLAHAGAREKGAAADAQASEGELQVGNPG